MSLLQDAAELLDTEPDLAYGLVQQALRDDADDARGLYLLGVIHARAERFTEALCIYERCTRLAPRRAEAWNALGQALDELHRPREAREAFKRALEIGKSALYLANVASTYAHEGNHAEAMRWARKAIALDPECRSARMTLGFAHLALGQYAEGWDLYESCLGGAFRKIEQIGSEPHWSGEPVRNLFVYGEQGLGDEIVYAQMLNDIPHSVRVTLECDQRLEGLFRRSFPAVEVHGTRRCPRDWAEGREFEAGTAIGSLTRLYRRDAASFKTAPYLAADPERRLQWRALFDSWCVDSRLPVIGICWSGGRHKTGAHTRDVGLEAFRSLIDRVPAHWVCLQYKDAADEIAATGLPVRQYARATLTNDYDDTAALVAELDHVIGPPTAVHHLAGALGVSSTLLVPSQPMWNVAHGDRLPWNADNVYHRQRPGESWADCIGRLPLDRTSARLHRL